MVPWPKVETWEIRVCVALLIMQRDYVSLTSLLPQPHGTHFPPAEKKGYQNLFFPKSKYFLPDISAFPLRMWHLFFHFSVWGERECSGDCFSVCLPSVLGSFGMMHWHSALVASEEGGGTNTHTYSVGWQEGKGGGREPFLALAFALSFLLLGVGREGRVQTSEWSSWTLKAISVRRYTVQAHTSKSCIFDWFCSTKLSMLLPKRSSVYLFIILGMLCKREKWVREGGKGRGNREEKGPSSSSVQGQGRRRKLEWSQIY